jgi:hypothetical protein
MYRRDFPQHGCDFLDGTLMASAGILAASACPQSTAAWAGYTGEGDYKNSAGNTERVG